MMVNESLGTDCDSCDSPVTVVTDHRIVRDATNGNRQGRPFSAFANGY